MVIEKLKEFAKNGQKNTDELDLEAGFAVNKKPARQWFNWLFNTLTLKINEIIDADYIQHAEITDNLTTNDAKKPLSAKQGKNLQDNKLDKTANAASATKLNQSRKIGGVSFDATKDIDLPGVNIQGNQNTSGVILTWLDNSFSNSDMSIDPEAAWNDSGRVTAKFTNSNNALAINVSGLYNERKVMIQSGHDTPTYAGAHGELQLNPLGGPVTANGSKVITVSEGIAVSATRLQNPRKIFGQNFDGTNEVTGTITVSTGLVQSDNFHYIDMGRDTVDRMSFYNYGATFNFIDSQDGNMVARITQNGIDCNAATASKLKTPRKINGIDFDGSADITLPTATTSASGTVQLNDTLTSTSKTQALTAAQGKAINDRFTNDFINLKAGNGYQKLPGGLILQWGVGSTSVNTVFPLVFPNAVSSIALAIQAGSSRADNIFYNQLTKSGFTSWGRTPDGNEATLGFTYLVIGY